MTTLGTFALLLAIGCAVGALSGLLGVGGGMLTIPTFRLILGMSAVATTATSLLVIIPTSITGAITHIREKTCVLWLGISMGLGGACTSAIGAYLASIAPSAVVMCVAAVVIGYSAFSMLRKGLKKLCKKKSCEKPPCEKDIQVQSQKDKQQVNQSAFEDKPTFKKCAIGFCIGLIAGLVAGFVGVGGGFIMVPLMTVAFDISMHKASGTSLVGIAILAIPGVIEHMILGNIEYMVAIAMCVGTIPGAVIGTKLGTRLSDQALRLIFGVMLIIVAVILVVNEFVAF